MITTEMFRIFAIRTAEMTRRSAATMRMTRPATSLRMSSAKRYLRPTGCYDAAGVSESHGRASLTYLWPNRPQEQIHETWLHSDRPVPSRFIRPVIEFTRIEAAGGIVLLVAAVVALVLGELTLV